MSDGHSHAKIDKKKGEEREEKKRKCTINKIVFMQLNYLYGRKKASYSLRIVRWAISASSLSLSYIYFFLVFF